MRLQKTSFILLVPLALGCSGSTTVPATGTTPEPSDPLAAAARALPEHTIHVERVRSLPADTEREQAEFEWTILARISLADVQVPSSQLGNAPRPSGLGWAVMRLTVKAGFQKQYEDRTRGPQGEWLPKPGRRHLSLDVQCQSVYYLPGLVSGRNSSGGQIRPGAGLTLKCNNYGPSLAGDFSPLTTHKVLLEVDAAPLDSLVKPLFPGPETLELPQALELVQVDQQITRLELPR